MPLLRARVESALRGTVALVLISAVAGCTLSGSGDQRSFEPTGAPELSAGDAENSRLKTAELVLQLDAPDTRAAELPVVEPSEAEGPLEVATTGGEARITGMVRLDGATVDDATVRLERWIDNESGAIEVATDADGRFVAEGLVGGRWVLRAWSAPIYALDRAVPLFVGDTEDLDLDLNLEVVLRGDVSITALLDGPVAEGDTVGLEISVRQTLEGTEQSVAGIGVTLGSFDGWALGHGITAVTDGEGVARWEATCVVEGAHSVTVHVAGLVREITLPSCGNEDPDEDPERESEPPDTEGDT